MMKSALIGLLLAVGCHSHDHSKTVTAVRVVAAQTGTGQAGSRYSASIYPASRVEVAFRVGGYVDRIAQVTGPDGVARPLQEGDRVTAGMVLASVQQSDSVEKVAEAQATVAEAQAARSQAQIDFGRSKRLFASQSISRAEFENSQTRYTSAVARLAGAVARRRQGDTMLHDSTLRSPLNGLIVRRAIEIGTLAQPGMVGFSVVDTSSVKVVFGVSDTVVNQLKLGDAQAITTEAFPGRSFVGRISRVGAAADLKSRSFEVEVTVANPSDELKSGMVASLLLSEPLQRAEANVTLLPLSAVVRVPGSRDHFAVYVVDTVGAGSVAHLRPVELGDFLGNQIPIKSGLAKGEKVVVMGASLLADGEPVRIIL